MAKNKKRRIANDDDFLNSFRDHLENTPGFSSLIKIIIFILFFIILTSCSRMTIAKEKKAKANTTTTTTEYQIQKRNYKNLVDEIKTKEATITISIGDVPYLIENLMYTDDTLSGMFESSNATKKFKVKDDIIYEYVLGQDKENADLFGEVDKIIVIPTNLINILETNRAINQTLASSVIYTYDNIAINNVAYTVTVKIEEDKITSILLISDNSKYDIQYK